MKLEQAFLLVAEALAPTCPQHKLAEAARYGLLKSLMGQPPNQLPRKARESLERWAERLLTGQDADAVASLYQQLLTLHVTRGEGGDLRICKESRAQRATGAYYTCPPVVQYMLDRARRYMPRAATIIDPACGPGEFLSQAWQMFEGALTELVGLDVDPVAIELSRQRIPYARVKVADALLDEVAGSFDLCLGNPPYISSGLRGAIVHQQDRLKALKARYPDTAQYKVNTYPLFVERGLELLRTGGVLGYILPDSFVAGRYFSGLRNLLLSHTILEITLIQQDFWEYGKVGRSVILFVRKGPAPPRHTVEIRHCPSVKELPSCKSEGVLQQDLAWGSQQRFLVAADPTERTLVRRVSNMPGSCPLGSYVRTYSGLIARNGQASILRSRNPDLPGPWGRLLRSGKELDRYRVSWAGEYVCLDQRLLKSGGCLGYYQNPKLLLRQTADSLKSAYDAEGFYCLNNIHLLIPRSAVTPLRALLAIINSQAMDRLYRALTQETGRLYPQVDLDLVASLPIPPWRSYQIAQLSSLVRERESAAPRQAAHIERQIDQVVNELYEL